ncbi:hypothetical protein J2X48_000883 [Bosea sp. BE271]|nr:hypothetical protein [Bosea robiniae]MDR6893025.1 hypothetical protein [Bosea sp. BE109]MDR7137277.1 hypothetical protein [Bosea sp. BE168]MDR7173977.1 hypothetical protein [Bosea sp. BE271]
MQSEVPDGEHAAIIGIAVVASLSGAAGDAFLISTLFPSSVDLAFD